MFQLRHYTGVKRHRYGGRVEGLNIIVNGLIKNFFLVRNERQPQDAMETEVLVDHYIPSRGLQIDHSNYVSGGLF